MSIATMNPAQMMVLESFASVQSNEELEGLMNVLRIFYAQKLDKEMQRLWDNGTLNQEKLDELKKEHIRTPYRQQ